MSIRSCIESEYGKFHDAMTVLGEHYFRVFYRVIYYYRKNNI